MTTQLELFPEPASAPHPPPGVDRPPGRIKIITWNVNGVRAREAQVARLLAEEAPDVLCLQEIKATAAQIPASLCDIEGYTSYWHGSGGYSGVALHVRRAAFASAPVFEHPDFDFENRIVTATMDCHPPSEPGATPLTLTVASVYVPNGGKDLEAKLRFLTALDGYVAAQRAERHCIVLCGDLNVARNEIDVHPKERKPNKAVIGQLPEERALLERLLSHETVDVGRAVAPDDEGLFTWWAPWRNMRERNIGWRIDYVVASRELADRVVECAVRAAVGTSDHAPVVAVFDVL